jgi:hypothetical protein
MPRVGYVPAHISAEMPRVGYVPAYISAEMPRVGIITFSSYNINRVEKHLQL